MQNFKLILTIISFFALLNTSCNSNDPSLATGQWKLQNTNYMLNMKDSAGFIKDTVASSIGNLYYYYKIVKQGDLTSGSPVSTDKVTVNYKGSLINGVVFDKTYTGNSPLTDSVATPRIFYLTNLIYGWKINLIQMKKGEIRTIILPQELGYGAYQSGDILPYSSLKFDIQLISFAH